MNLNRIMFAAPGSGSGKTTITCAFLEAVKRANRRVVSFKCGPDYIDPMFHSRVLGIPSKNLDTFFTGEEMTRALFMANRQEDELAVMEGVMGLFDGLGGIREEGSSYHLAKVTGTPIILVVDAKGMGKSLIALIAGFLRYDTEHLIKGVLLNRMSKAYYDILKPLIEEELNITVVGYFKENKALHTESRHLGLFMPQDIPDLKAKIDTAADALEETVSLSKIFEISKMGTNLMQQEISKIDYVPTSHTCCSTSSAPIIAVARDEAFCFYYEDNLRLLREAGASLIYFSPLQDEKIPEHCSGLLLGGGYPELYADRLSKNKSMLMSIRQAYENKMPMVAECGGFLYLHENIRLRNGDSYPMVGVLSGSCTDMGKLVRFGYIEVNGKEGSFLPKDAVARGHEFHYFDSENNGRDCLAKKPVTGKTYPCIQASDWHFLGFPHLYYPSYPDFALNFVNKAAAYEKHEQ